MSGAEPARIRLKAQWAAANTMKSVEVHAGFEVRSRDVNKKVISFPRPKGADAAGDWDTIRSTIATDQRTCNERKLVAAQQQIRLKSFEVHARSEVRSRDVNKKVISFPRPKGTSRIVIQLGSQPYALNIFTPKATGLPLKPSSPATCIDTKRPRKPSSGTCLDRT